MGGTIVSSTAGLALPTDKNITVSVIGGPSKGLSHLLSKPRVVIGRRGGGVRETFTVRKVSYGVGVERVFPVHSPGVARIEVVRRGKVRRAKLYYLRSLRGKAARLEEQFEEK